jgi:hypothetical protein
MSSYADTIGAALKAATRETWRATFESGTTFSVANTAVTKADDLVEVLARTIDLLVAAEGLHAAADAAVKTLRASLAEAMNSSGASTVQGTHHSANLARKPAFVSIENEGEVPDEYWVTKRALDKKAIASAIKAGVVVPSASLLTPNEMTLQLRAKKETPQ